MSDLPKSKDELPFCHEFVEPAANIRTDALIYWCAVVLFVWVLMVAVMSIAGFAGYVYTRWLA